VQMICILFSWCHCHSIICQPRLLENPGF